MKNIIGKVVIKANNSCKGKDVYLFENKKEAIDKVNELFERGESSVSICPFEDIITEYRVIFLDDNIEYIYKKEKPENSWKHNLSLGAIPREVTDSDKNLEEISLLAKRAAKAMNLKFASIDISLAKNGRIFAMEINASVCMSEFIQKFPNGREIAKNIYKKAILKMLS